MKNIEEINEDGEVYLPGGKYIIFPYCEIINLENSNLEEDKKEFKKYGF